jgi:hypothetical protein
MVRIEVVPQAFLARAANVTPAAIWVRRSNGTQSKRCSTTPAARLSQ